MTTTISRQIRIAVGALAGVGAALCTACSSGSTHHGGLPSPAVHKQALTMTDSATASTIPPTSEVPGPTGDTGPGSGSGTKLDDAGGSTDPGSPSVLGTYNGTWTVTVTNYDYCATGTLQADGTASGSFAGQLVVVAPHTDGATTESNPFGFVFQGGDLQHSGSISLASGIVVTTDDPDSTGNPNVLLQYWSVQQSGDQVQATLTDPHQNEGAAYNDIWLDRLLVPCRPELGTLGAFPLVIAPGATITGTIGGGHVQLTMQAQTVDGSATFTAEFTS